MIVFNTRYILITSVAVGTKELMCQMVTVSDI